MAFSNFRKRFEQLLAVADIQINGDRPWDMRVLKEETYPRIFAFGSLGMGESYMDGWWDCEQLDEMVCRASRLDLKSLFRPSDLVRLVQARLINPKGDTPRFAAGEAHYEVGQDLYRGMLDKRMIYSCAYWTDAETLDEAQENKLDLIARKLGLEPGMKILDIGCGWGGAIHYFRRALWSLRRCRHDIAGPIRRRAGTCAPACRSTCASRTIARSTNLSTAATPSTCLAMSDAGTTGTTWKP